MVPQYKNPRRVFVQEIGTAPRRGCCESGEQYGRALHATPRLSFLHTAHWVASRHGLDAELVDVEAERAVPVREVIEALLAFARPALEEHGDWEEVSTLVSDTLKQGNGARRQRRAHERAGRLEDVVDMLIEETAQGTDSA
jgi:carboxylate-amine ligase